jgi:DEAD/DEAH box helicase domain-containing protein
MEREVLLFAEDSLNLLEQMRQQQWLLPQVGYELVNQTGKVIAEAEFAWSEQKTALLLDDCYLKTFRDSGWNVALVSEIITKAEFFRQMYLTT